MREEPRAMLDEMERMGHESVIVHRDAGSGLRAFIAIHSTARGPALGGTRWYPYGSEAEALEDVLRLSSAMTAKAAAAGLPIGGGKAVVLGDPGEKTAAQLSAYAALVESLGGRYVTTTDVGTTTKEMDLLRQHTRYVVGVSPEVGGSGDTSELTAVTVLEGMRAALQFAFGTDALKGRHVVVQGVGKVGARIAREAAEQGARLTLADVRSDVVRALARELDADLATPEGAVRIECDVLSPNALGNVLSVSTIPDLRCRVVCGAANNQLGRDPEDARLLGERGIVYAPDYVVNCGGLISAATEWEGGDTEQAWSRAARVYETTLTVLETARRDAVSTAVAAGRLVEQRLAVGGRAGDN